MAQLIDLIKRELDLRIHVSTLNSIIAGRHRWFTALHLEHMCLHFGYNREIKDALLTLAHHWFEHNDVLTQTTSHRGAVAQIEGGVYSPNLAHLHPS